MAPLACDAQTGRVALADPVFDPQRQITRKFFQIAERMILARGHAASWVETIGPMPRGSYSMPFETPVRSDNLGKFGPAGMDRLLLLSSLFPVRLGAPNHLGRKQAEQSWNRTISVEFQY